MCRFVAYLGKKSVLLSDVLEKPANSLINQSREAREAKKGLNADGFGIGWYNHDIDDFPGVYKSTQPAWNDANLRHLASKILTRCFIGHVRASTVGDVNFYNCHPFSHETFLFVHNGTIHGFDHLKRSLSNSLSDPFFNRIHGQTDSEYFFMCWMMKLSQLPKPYTLEGIMGAFESVIQLLKQEQRQHGEPISFKLNTVLTDGHFLFATRYISEPHEEPLSLYYAIEGVNSLFRHSEAVLVASEPLTDYTQEWLPIAVNSALWVDSDLTISTKDIKG